MKTSASCGVATMLPEDSVEDLLGAADQALYQAKANGRNRTQSAIRGTPAGGRLSRDPPTPQRRRHLRLARPIPATIHD